MLHSQSKLGVFILMVCLFGGGVLKEMMGVQAPLGTILSSPHCGSCLSEQ